MQCVILTTINKPGDVTSELIKRGYEVIVVGDEKTPSTYHDINVIFIDLEEQYQKWSNLAKKIPLNHYARKNLGYIYAINSGYSKITEIDDDTLPLEHWPNVDGGNTYDQIIEPQFPNIYKLYSDAHIWPRGFPLDRIRLNETIGITIGAQANVYVWQGLVNGDPDVDAIFRLTNPTPDNIIDFQPNRKVTLAEGVITAFNTQNTTWVNESAFPYLYLPSHVTFRVTDILKSYVAQFCIWAIGGVIGFNGGTAVQDRNPHDLMKDFEQELPIYQYFYDMIEVLSSVNYVGAPHDLFLTYAKLVEARLVPEEELEIVEAWLDAI